MATTTHQVEDIFSVVTQLGKSALCSLTKGQLIGMCVKVTLSEKLNKLAKQKAVLIPGDFTDRVETHTAVWLSEFCTMHELNTFYPTGRAISTRQ